MAPFNREAHSSSDTSMNDMIVGSRVRWTFQLHRPSWHRWNSEPNNDVHNKYIITTPRSVERPEPNEAGLKSMAYC